MSTHCTRPQRQRLLCLSVRVAYYGDHTKSIHHPAHLMELKTVHES
ncbi:MAG: hypothetical protein GWN67_02830 [Phycisphaerae bacterium]|nr:hypothetical protein [Phycisphaerae bacterium]NIP50885.1 hypothetical protein [Phycisphaerae bacterium]NIS50081.1 hypothetical protein [Phycisphaerae bacterium]NIU07736.1 hypothetical protein [Phycisphaerae bacterium]NIU55360.1 hypothetical protein [Phycisphaerae bacterium]